MQGTPTGTIESVPGYEPSFKADVTFGADWLSFDPDGKHARINLKGMARFVSDVFLAHGLSEMYASCSNHCTVDHRTESNSAIDFRYKGIIKMPPEVQKLFNGDPTMATVPFGHASKSLPSLASCHCALLHIPILSLRVRDGQRLTSFVAGAHTFLVADPALKDLENSVFVSNGRIIVHEKGLTVETRQSLVVAATVMD